MHISKRTLASGLAALAVVTGAACGGDASPLPSASSAPTSTAVVTTESVPTSLATTLPQQTMPETAPASPTAGEQVASLALPDGFEYPEGIAVDPATGTLFVTSIAGGAVASSSPDGSFDVLIPANADGKIMAGGVAATSDRLWLAGGYGAALYEYTLDGVFVGSHASGPGGFLNDVVVTDDGVFVTDSVLPTLWRLPLASEPDAPLEAFIDLTDEGVTYGEGFNWNGIRELSDGSLIAAQTSTGQLFRVDVAARTVSEIQTDSAPLLGADGLVVDDLDVYVVRNSSGRVDTVRLCPDLSCGAVRAGSESLSMQFPTTAVIVDGQLLVVGSQFDRGGPIGPGEPQRPFTINVFTLE